MFNWSHISDDFEFHPERHSFAAAIFISSYSRVVLIDFKIMTQSHVAAITLALRLYALDHDNQLPAMLQELVPKYLPALPGDPMALGAPPMRYIPDAADPRIYSAGSNGKDDGGSEEIENKKRAPREEYDPWERSDAVFHYRLQARIPAVDRH